MNIEQLRADMEAGTQGDWEHDAPNLRVVSLPNRGVCALVYDTDGRRIARVPQLERIALAAEALANTCDDVFDNIDAVGTVEFYRALDAYREATQ
jgi:hypothetical protein